MWENNNVDRYGVAHYSIFSLLKGVEGMDAIRKFFPHGVADEMNLILFSTSGVHGSYTTIEDIEEILNGTSEETDTELTFLIVQPRIVALRYGRN